MEIAEPQSYRYEEQIKYLMTARLELGNRAGNEGHELNRMSWNRNLQMLLFGDLSKTALVFRPRAYRGRHSVLVKYNFGIVCVLLMLCVFPFERVNFVAC